MKKTTKQHEPGESKPPTCKPDPDQENLRVAIMLGVIATLIAILASEPPLIIALPVVVYLIMPITYVMLCGLHLLYPTTRGESAGFSNSFEGVRRRTYNGTIKLYWLALIVLIYMGLMSILGFSPWGSVAVAGVILAVAMILGLLSIIFIRKWAPTNGR